MTTSDDGTTDAPLPQGFPEPAPDELWWGPPPNDPLKVRRSIVQARLIQQAWQAQGVDLVVARDAQRTAVSMYAPRRVLVRTAAVDAVCGQLGIEPPGQRTSRLEGLTVLGIPDDPRPLEVILRELDESVGEGVATPDHLLHVCKTWCAPAEPVPGTGSVPTGFNLDVELDGHDRRVAVVDTGLFEDVVAEHSWLAGVTGEPEPAGVGHYRGHGTFIAGVVRSYAPAAAVNVEAVLTVGGTVFESDMVDGLCDSMDLSLVESRPEVISFSGGTCTRLDRPLLSFEVFWEEVLQGTEGETVLVAAAGNDGDEGPFWPAAFEWAYGIGALDGPGDARAGFSNFGPWVDAYALGTDILNAYPTGPYEYLEPPRTGQVEDFPDGLAVWSGTSFATPMVAGLIAARVTLRGGSARDSADALVAYAAANPGSDGSPALTSAEAARLS
ncbi:S8/S53 family peptidase [Terrabacter sp. LjRoot27]|uniref:S8 family peptidase n=1 Tax=Terrabacter sp. LjRoot27 TaxID=3342306 RepID=UPI003ECC40D4